ncbi:MAG: right-handed parallel beta-helix repeat-containing protein [Candidatus Lokiarchaeia archaeon]
MRGLIKRKAVKIVILAAILLTGAIMAISIQNQNTNSLINTYTLGIFSGSHIILEEKTLYISSDYTFTENIYEPIVVTANNIVIDGNGYTLQGLGSGYGFYLNGRSNVTIKNVTVKGWDCGFYLNSCLYINLIDNTVSNSNDAGFRLKYSSYNNLIGNTANNNYRGFHLSYNSDNNNFTGNTAAINDFQGFYLDTDSNYNLLTGNNATNNLFSGFELYYSSYNKLTGNIAVNNNYSFILSYNSHNTLTGNVATHTQNGSYVLSSCYYISSSNNNNLTNNTGINNRYGFLIRDSNNNIIHSNLAINSTKLYSLEGSCSGNDLTDSVAANFLQVEVLDINGDSLQGAEVKVETDGDTVYASPGFGGNNATTDENGLTDWIVVPYQTYVGGTTAVQKTNVVTVNYLQFINSKTVDMSTSRIETFSVILPEIWEDTIISETWIRMNVYILLNGNLTIANEGSLTLTNVTLLVNCTYNGEHRIEVQSGGALYINDSDGNPLTINDATIITAYNPDNAHNFLFRVQSGAIFQMNNSEIHYCGYDNWPNMDCLGPWININNTIIENNSFSNNCYGIVLQNAYNNTIRNNNATNNTYNGFFLVSSSNNELINNTALNNNHWSGFYLKNSSNNILSGNTANNNVDGFSLSTGSNNNTLSGNIANNNSIYGISIDSYSNNSILSGNIANNNGNYGIALYYSSNNTLSGNIANNNMLSGFRLYSSSNNTLSGNNATSNHNDGFYLWWGSNNTFSSNNATSNGRSGFYLYGTINIGGECNNNFLLGNTAIKNNYGFHLYNSTDNKLMGNTAINNTYGFYLEGSSSGNDLTGSVVANYLRVEVLDYDGGAVQGADVKVEVDGTPVYASPGFGGSNSTTDQYGLTDWIIVPYQTFTGGVWVGNTTVVTVKFSIMIFSYNPRTVGMSVSHIENFTATPAIWGDTIISEPWNISNIYIILNGNLTIASEGSLTLTNVNLEVNCTYNGEHRIEVQNNGALYINGSSIITALSTSNMFLFWVQSGATFQMNDSELHYCGYNDPDIEYDIYNYGLWINTNNTIIDNNTLTNNYCGIVIQNSYYNTIRNNTATNNSVGFFLHSSSYNELVNNTATNNGWCGFRLEVGSDNNNITSNIVANNIGDGFELSWGSNNLFSGNNVTGNGNTGFFLYSTVDRECNNNLLSGNTASNNSGHGFALYGYGEYYGFYNNLTGNTAINNGGDGFFLDSNSHNLILTGNTAINNNGCGFNLYFVMNRANLSGNTAINSNYGFRLYHSTDNKLMGNTAINNTYGFYLEYDSTGNDLTGSIVANYLRVEVLRYSGGAVQGAEVRVEVDGGTIYASPGFGGSNSTTDQNGLTDWIIVPYQTYISGNWVNKVTTVIVGSFGLNITNSSRVVSTNLSHKETFFVALIDSYIATDIGAGASQHVDASAQMGIELTLNLTAPVRLSIIKTIDNMGGNEPSDLIFLGKFVSIEVNDTTAIQGITIIIHYTDQEVSSFNLNENSLAVWYWNETSGNWIKIPSIVDTQNNIVTAYVNHLTHFAILGRPIPPGTPFSSYLPFLLLLLTPSGLNPLIYLALGLVAVALVTVATLGLRRRREAEVPEREMVLEVRRATPTSWKPKREMVPVRQTPITRRPQCVYCGCELSENAKFCPLCGKAIAICSVCNRDILSGEVFVECPYCHVPSHRDHLLEWIKVKGYCPNCKERLSRLDIV